MTPVNVQTDYPTAELTRARCRQAIGSVSLLLVVALALSTTVRVGRPALVDSGRDGEQGRAVAVTVQTVQRPTRRVTCERPSASEAPAAFRTSRAAPPGRLLLAEQTLRPMHLRETLLDLPPPVC